MKPKVIQDDPEANAVWDELQDVLEKAGKWRAEYAGPFAVLVHSFVRWRAVTEQLAAEGHQEILYNPQKGTAYRNPLLDVAGNYVNQIQRYAAAFGLTPMADTKLKANPTEALGVLFNLLRGPE
jgi:P27 family predicted phage terminase small subunit